MKIFNPLWGFRWIVLGLLISTASHAIQRIMSDTGSEYVGSQETITYSGIYSVSSPHTGEETGIGLRVHYNSSLLTPVANQLYSVGAQPEGAITDDTEDYDSDPLTDKYFILAWIDTNAQWPGQSALPLTLFESEFETVANFSESTDIRITASSTAKNTSFSSEHLEILPKPATLVNLSTGKTSVTEGSSGSLIIYVTRTNEDLSAPLEVFLQLGGTASAGSDYLDFPASIVIPAGKTRGFATLVLKDDASNESQEVITLSILASEQYQRGTSSTLQLTIEDDEISQNTNLPVDQETKTTNNAIPTLNEWILLLMSLFMAGLALTHLTDKKQLLTKTRKPAIPTTNRRGKT